MTRATLRLLAKPEPVAAVARPVYPKVPLYACGTAIDRRADWYAKRDALEAERNQARARSLSLAVKAE